MRHFLSIASAFALALFASGQAAAQQPPAQPPITRTVVAATKLPTLTDQPLLFRALSVTIPPGEKSSVSTADGILYQMSGSTEVSIGGEAKTLSPGEGMFLAGGKLASMKTGTGEASTLLHFLLVPVADQDQPVETKPAIVKELYRTAAPISDLKPGSYDLNLTRVTFPAQMPSNPPHHRSGAALYYIVSGTGANTVNWQNGREGTRLSELRAVRFGASVGKSKRYPFHVLGLQHQSRGCGSGYSGRADEVIE